MSRRSGKAASRRARQQRRSRSRPASAGLSAAAWSVAAPGPAPASPGPAPSGVVPASVSSRPFAAAGPMAGTSRLGEAARAEYHYVARDLRNTAILVLLMAVLLGVAIVVVNAIGIGPG